jgi:hypothetical protein
MATIHLSRGIVEDRSDLDAELLLASPALPPLLVGKPDSIADLPATRAGDLTVGPLHLCDRVDANLLIGKVLYCVYESGGICHYSTIPN